MLKISSRMLIELNKIDNMKKIIFYIMLSVLYVNIAKAVVVQRVYLKNGSVLNGYIQKQDKNDNITFRSESAVISVSGQNATTTERVYKISDLDKKWIEWAEKNDAFNGVGESRTLTLNEVIFSHDNSYDITDSVAVIDEQGVFENEFKIAHPSVMKVRVLEKGLRIKYLELTPNTYNFSWDDVESIKADKREKTALSGIDRIYQLKNGQEVRGQYAGESYNTLSLYTNSGMVETFDINNVTKYFYKPLNPNQDIMEQSELVDVVRTKNNGTFRGIIVERNFAEGSNYLVIQQQTGASQMLKFADVIEYSKEDNSEYKPKYDIILKKDEVVINRVAADSVGVNKKGVVAVLDSINHNVIIPNAGNKTKIAVEFFNPKHLSSDNLILVKVDKSVVKKKTVYSFSTDIFVMKKFPMQGSETSVNHTTRVEYEVEGQGVFALYDPVNKKAMPFIVK